MAGMFRELRADEIDCRVKVVKDTGVSLLLYKDARCDQNILDEAVGAMNWQRSHSRDNANCTVSIWDADKKMWVLKEDTGTESNTEAEKGVASDSFKRACFNWGIGRELYTAPFIWISGANKKDEFKVKEIEYENGVISKLVIVDAKGNIAYEMGKRVKYKPPKEPEASAEHKKLLDDMCKKLGVKKTEIISQTGWKKGEPFTEEYYNRCLLILREIEDGRG